jgi:queuine/archaeosine tRNA-ribosyltransferase
VIEKAGGIHTLAKYEIPLMSDSAGFQVFSLARNKRVASVHGEENPLVVRIYEDGVDFRSVYDGSLYSFSPEKSMEYQRKIGADIMMAFDECTDYASSYEYTKKAMNRTHDWLKRCIEYLKQNESLYGYPQYLYGVIQGGAFQDLREASARYILKHDTPGVAIGSVANGGESKRQLREQVEFVGDYLPADKPVHLLGIGHFDDIFDTVGYGIDTFDCVEPTRLARMGVMYKVVNDSPMKIFMRGKLVSNLQSTKNQEGISATTVNDVDTRLFTQQIGTQTDAAFKNFISSSFTSLDITKNVYKSDLSGVDKNCGCYVCTNFTKAYLHHLFKQKELLGYTLATYHNLWVMEKFMEAIRFLIGEDLL